MQINNNVKFLHGAYPYNALGTLQSYNQIKISLQCVMPGAWKKDIYHSAEEIVLEVAMAER